MERGESHTKIDTFVKVCEVFSVTPNEILCDKETASPINDPVEMPNKLGVADKKPALRLPGVYIDSKLMI